MAGVFRRKNKAWSKDAIMGYSFHGVFALLALWMFLNAVA